MKLLANDGVFVPNEAFLNTGETFLDALDLGSDEIFEVGDAVVEIQEPAIMIGAKVVDSLLQMSDAAILEIDP